MTGQLTNLLSFRRIADTPFDTYMAALDSWQLTRHDGELRLGNSLLRGPIERDRHFGTCRIQVRLARRPLRPPIRMRLDIEPWSPTATALELIPCQRVRPSAAYFAVGHRLLDSLTRTPPARADAAAPRSLDRVCAVFLLDVML
jgi:hypothetical protein